MDMHEVYIYIYILYVDMSTGSPDKALPIKRGALSTNKCSSCKDSNFCLHQPSLLSFQYLYYTTLHYTTLWTPNPFPPSHPTPPPPSTSHTQLPPSDSKSGPQPPYPGTTLPPSSCPSVSSVSNTKPPSPSPRAAG